MSIRNSRPPWAIQRDPLSNLVCKLYTNPVPKNLSIPRIIWPCDSWDQSPLRYRGTTVRDPFCPSASPMKWDSSGLTRLGVEGDENPKTLS
jgi:hypothetical protein